MITWHLSGNEIEGQRGEIIVLPNGGGKYHYLDETDWNCV